MIELERVSMGYPMHGRTIEVLADVDLSVSASDSVAIVGPSGSGKTTLLLLLAGLEQPLAGDIRVGGTPLRSLTADQLADLRRDHLGIVFQSFHLVPSLSALDNVALPLEIAGRRDARQRARDMLVRVGLDHRERHYPAQLSGGEQQRVAIARALVHAPALILADEPTGNLDLGTGQMVGDLLFDLHDESGATLLLVTHDERIARRCGRVCRLHDARLRDDGNDHVQA
jgi:putative ABC transport system ATP-binding protein